MRENEYEKGELKTRKNGIDFQQSNIYNENRETINDGRLFPWREAMLMYITFAELISFSMLIVAIIALVLKTKKW